MKLSNWVQAGEKGRNQVDLDIENINPKQFVPRIDMGIVGGTELFLENAEASELFGLSVPVEDNSPLSGYRVQSDQGGRLYIFDKGTRYYVPEEELIGYLARRQIQTRII